MKRKNTLLIIAIALCFIACLLLLLVNVLGLDIIKHYDTQLGELSIKYYGNFEKVSIVKVYDGAIRRATLELNVTKEMIESANEHSPYLEDLDGDGYDDLMIPHSKDHNGAARYAAFIWNEEIDMYEANPLLADIANVKLDEERTLISNMVIRIVTYPEQPNSPEFYEESKILKEYKLCPDGFKLAREYTLIYYSETDIYCFVKHDYNTESGELASAVEDWLTPEEAIKINLS